jgi:predicted ArsR family transcriptional regulator
VRLTHRLLDEILSLDTRETQGRDGRALAGLVFERMAERLALEYGPRLRAGNLEERARRAAALLAEEGIDFEVMPAPGPATAANGAVHLVGRGCPCRRVGQQTPSGTSNGHTATIETTGEARAHSAPAGCEHDRHLLERLLGDRVTILTQDALPGDSLCGYRLDPAPTAPSTPLVPLA